jgi:transcriptional regulator with XRE-family HTH domain
VFGVSINDADRLAWLRTFMEQPGAARSLRQSSGLSEQDMATAIGVTPSAIGRWERGERIPRGPRAVDYARLLQRLHRRALAAAP